MLFRSDFGRRGTAVRDRGEGVAEQPFEMPFGPVTVNLYAMAARRHMYEFGTTSEQLAQVKVAASHHAQWNPNAVIKKVLTTEFNIEGNPTEASFVDLVLANKPQQVTLVPDARGQLTSNHGWDTLTHQQYLKDIISVFKKEGIRVSIFVDPDPAMVEGAAGTGTDRIELYTESYAVGFAEGKKESAIEPFIRAAQKAKELGLGINAGHDLDLHNLKYFSENIPGLLEVSIGHALISDALYYGLENTVGMYKRQLALANK